MELNADLPKLPKGWVWTKLENITLDPKQDIVDGPFGSNMKASEYIDNGVPVIRLQNIERNYFLTKNIKYISKEKAFKLSRHGFSTGDIVLTKLGDPLGKACLITDKNEFQWGIIVADIVRIRLPEQFIQKNYISNLINSEIVAKQLKENVKGTTRPRVNLTYIRNIFIPLPPLPEQHRIVNKIEELFTKLDAGIDALKKIKIQLKRYRQAVLKDAFEGKLTQQWREVHKEELEPASVLLERIKEQRKKESKGKFKELPPIDTSELYELPEGWVWTKLDNCVDILDSQRVPINAKEREKRKGNIPYYGATGQVGWIDDFIFDEELILLGEDGAPFLDPHKPKAYIIRGKSWVNNHAHVLRAIFNLTTNAMLCYYLNIFDFHNYVTGTTRLKLNQSPMTQIPIPLPPLPEQHQIVAEIERRLSVADQLEKVVEQCLKQADRLRQSILKHAFEGKLVPQDPTDEPAEKLLERIKKEKESGDLIKQKSRKRK